MVCWRHRKYVPERGGHAQALVQHFNIVTLHISPWISPGMSTPISLSLWNKSQNREEPSNFAFEVGSHCILHSQSFSVSKLDTSPWHSGFVGSICSVQAALFVPLRSQGFAACQMWQLGAGAVRSSTHALHAPSISSPWFRQAASRGFSVGT